MSLSFRGATEKTIVPVVPTTYVKNLAGGQPTKLHTCTKCNGHVAWAKGASGKSYPCDVDTFNHDNGMVSHKARPWQPHFKTCGERVSDQQIWEDDQRSREIAKKHTDKFMELTKKIQSGEVAPSDLQRHLDELGEAHNADREAAGLPPLSF